MRFELQRRKGRIARAPVTFVTLCDDLSVEGHSHKAQSRKHLQRKVTFVTFLFFS
ncbi:MAG: hypothetical protein JWM95_2424 [Gemmatimonadetes bacterium]|nr:hypothetical protein [Gemmatimonadota bacterium]